MLPNKNANLEIRFTIDHDYRKEKYSMYTVHVYVFIRKINEKNPFLN